jgi:hypothetical protein
MCPEAGPSCGLSNYTQHWQCVVITLYSRVAVATVASSSAHQVRIKDNLHGYSFVESESKLSIWCKKEITIIVFFGKKLIWLPFKINAKTNLSL